MRTMRKIMVLGVAGVLSLAMGTSAFAADSAGRSAFAAIGRHMNYSGCIESIACAKEYCHNYSLSGDVRTSSDTCVSGYLNGSALADNAAQNKGVCVQGCSGGYVDEDNNGICDSCEAAGYHGYCDNFVDADGNGVCDNLHNGYNYGNVSEDRNGGHHFAGHRRGCRR